MARFEQDLFIANAFASGSKLEAPWYCAWNIIPMLNFTFATFFVKLPATMSALIFPQFPITVEDAELIDNDDIDELCRDIIRDISPTGPSPVSSRGQTSEETVKARTSLLQPTDSLSPLALIPTNVSLTSPPLHRQDSEVGSLTDRFATMQSPGRDIASERATLEAHASTGRATVNQDRHEPSLWGPTSLLSPIKLKLALPDQGNDIRTPDLSTSRIEMKTQDSGGYLPPEYLKLTPHRRDLLQKLIIDHVKETLKTKSKRIPDFVLKLVEVEQKDGKPIRPFQIKCHRTVLLIEIKAEAPSYQTAKLGVKEVWDSQVKEQAMYTFKDCPALERVAAIVAFGPLWFYGEFDRNEIKKKKRDGDDDTYVPSDSSDNSDSEGDEDDDDRGETRAKDEPHSPHPPADTQRDEPGSGSTAKGASESEHDATDSTYESLYKTFHENGDETKRVLLHMSSVALQLVGARLMELARQLWPELAAEEQSHEV